MDLAQYRWLWQMLRNCTHERYAINKARMVRMSEYSRDCLNELRAQIGIEFEGRDLGTTQLFRTQQQLDASAQDIEIWPSTACRTRCWTAPASSSRTGPGPCRWPGRRAAPAA